ncbi:MAG: hypothetical protein V7607_1083 [Solirubrobacteraceae bacterium]
MPSLSADDLVALALPGGSDAQESIVRALRGLAEGERRPMVRSLTSVRRELAREFKWEPGSAVALALLGTATLAELKRLGMLGVPGNDDLAFEVLADRKPSWLGEWAGWIVGERSAWFPFVRRLVRAGLIDAPDADGYILGLVALPQTLAWEREGVTVREVLLDDRDLLSHEIWRTFEVEGGGEVSLAALDKYRGGWTETMLELSASGHLARDRLLDASLAALARDFSSFRAGWYSRFHEALEPTASERAARTDAYLRLLSSHVANTVSFALKALNRLAKAGRLEDRDDLSERLRPALASERRTVVTAALALLPAGEKAALAACAALGHRDAAVQASALKVIERALTATVRTEMFRYADDVAPTLRERFGDALGVGALPTPDEQAVADLEDLRARAAPLLPAARALAGVDAALEAAGDGAVPTRLDFAVADLPITACAEPVAPLDDVDELIETLARWVEGTIGVGGQLERALDALARMGAQRPEDFERRTSSLRSRAAALDERTPARALVEAWLDGTPPGERAYRRGRDLSDGRLHELAAQLAERRAQPLLATPTHAGGWIDPRALAARLVDVPMPRRHDLIAALCRLAPDRRDPDSVPDHPAADVIRYALGGPPPTDADLALLRAVRLGRELDHAEPPGRYTVEPWQWGVDIHIDLGPIEYELARVVPALRLGIRAHAPFRVRGWWPGDGRDPVRSLAVRLDTAPAVEEAALIRPSGSQQLWAESIEARHQTLVSDTERSPREGGAGLLGLALDPDRPLGDIGALAIAIGLAVGEPTQEAVALDAAIAAIADSRLDGPTLGAPARNVLAAGIVLPTRLAPALRTVAAESPLHAEVVRVSLEHAVAISPPPRGTHALLDALNELAADAGAGVELPPARAALGAISGSSKAAKLARQLLQREGTSRFTATAAALSVQARIERAARWSAD